MADDKPPVEAALDLLVYAPLGLALEARTLLPSLAERGRNQVMVARMLGRFAVQQGQAEASKRLAPVHEQVEAVLADLGLVPRPAPQPAPAPPPAPAAPAADVARSGPDGPPAASDPSVAASELAITDYDSLAASQVVPRLRALSDTELEDVRAYEAAHRARKTILNRIAQLQSS